MDKQGLSRVVALWIGEDGQYGRKEESWPVDWGSCMFRWRSRSLHRIICFASWKRWTVEWRSGSIGR